MLCNAKIFTFPYYTYCFLIAKPEYLRSKSIRAAPQSQDFEINGVKCTLKKSLAVSFKKSLTVFSLPNQMHFQINCKEAAPVNLKSHNKVPFPIFN